MSQQPIHGEHVILTLVPVGAGPPLAVRVRSFLKRALRAYGLRCVGVDGEINEPSGQQSAEVSPPNPKEGQT